MGVAGRRPTPQWFLDAKFGIFIHWGVYSVPAWGAPKSYAEWYWNNMADQKPDNVWWQFHKKNYGETFEYKDFAPRFKAELFDADQWADILYRSGAKYVVPTSKHHDGFASGPAPRPAGPGAGPGTAPRSAPTATCWANWPRPSARRRA